jgi:hypothetical protein
VLRCVERFKCACVCALKGTRRGGEPRRAGGRGQRGVTGGGFERALSIPRCRVGGVVGCSHVGIAALLRSECGAVAGALRWWGARPVECVEV